MNRRTAVVATLFLLSILPLWIWTFLPVPVTIETTFEMNGQLTRQSETLIAPSLFESYGMLALFINAIVSLICLIPLGAYLAVNRWQSECRKLVLATAVVVSGVYGVVMMLFWQVLIATVIALVQLA